MPRSCGQAKESWEVRTCFTLPPDLYQLVELVAQGYDNQVIAELTAHNDQYVRNTVNRLVHRFRMPYGYLIRPYIAKLYWQGKIHCREGTNGRH